MKSGWVADKRMWVLLVILVFGLGLVGPGVAAAQEGEGELPNLLEVISPGVQTILEALIAAAVPVLVYHIKLWLEAAKKRAEQLLTAEQYEMAGLIIRNLVLAAEQIYKDGHGAEKKKFVLQRAREALARYGLQLDLEQLDNLIEGLVWEEFNGSVSGSVSGRVAD